MTMPHERTRSLRWGGEVLQEICDDASVNESERARAAELLQNYPTPVTVSHWIQSDVYCIPLEAARAIEGTGELLRFILPSPACSAPLRRSVLFALRHFPQSGTADHWSRTDQRFSITQWLLPENLYG